MFEVFFNSPDFVHHLEVNGTTAPLSREQAVRKHEAKSYGEWTPTWPHRADIAALFDAKGNRFSDAAPMTTRATVDDTRIEPKMKFAVPA
jgi:hypothetical protein